MLSRSLYFESVSVKLLTGATAGYVIEFIESKILWICVRAKKLNLRAS